MNRLFSVNAAAELLERDRATITRSLRNVPPDGQESNSPRWTMKTIFDAMARHQGQTSSSSSDADKALDDLYAEFDLAFEKMKLLPTLPKRRSAALALAPLIERTDRGFRNISLANGQDPDLVELRADKIYSLVLRGFEAPCKWHHDQAWENIGAAIPSRC